MSFLAKLFINGEILNVLDTDIRFYQQVDPSTFKPNSVPMGGIFYVTIEASAGTELLRLMLDPDDMCNGYIRFYRRDGLSKLTDYEFFDTFVVGFRTEFSAYDSTPMTHRLVFSPGILRIGDVVFEKWWKVTDLDREEVVVTPEPVVPRPKLASVQWKGTDGSQLEETRYGNKVALEIAVANSEGGSVEITIEKEDGTEFGNGQKTLTFTEYLNDEGIAEISSLHIKDEWNNVRSSETDALVAKVRHKGISKQSGKLEIVPPPKVVVDFRPSKGYDGEYGFDFMRDKKEKGDTLNYKDILGTNYEYDKAKNKWVEQFKKYPDDKKYDSLKDDHYKTLTFDWYKDANGKDIEYLQSWLAIYPKQKATLSLQLDTLENPKSLDLTFEYDKEFFKLSTDSVPGQGKGKKRLDDHLEIECLKEFDTDQTVKIMYEKRQLGQLNILKNDKANRYQAKVVFIKVKTELIKGTSNTGDDTGEKEFLEKYLKQALIKLDLSTEMLDLSTDAAFNKKFAGMGKGYIDSRVDIHNYLNKKMDAKYRDHLKIYFIPEKCPVFDSKGTVIARVNGQAEAIPSKAVVLFEGHNTSTTTHESIHALGVRHTFDDKASYGYKKGETINIMDYSHQSIHGSKQRIMTWHWQWKQIWKNVTKE